jgi:FkbM family methyltransferase
MTTEQCSPSYEAREPVMAPVMPVIAPVMAPQSLHDGQSYRWQKLRERVVEVGIRAIWGEAAFPTSMSADIPLISAGWRFAWLKALGAAGMRNFVATSGLGFKFVCHIGDLAEYPFYHRHAFRNELAVCAAWLAEEAEPVVFDIGANVGFFCTHLAQMNANAGMRIYAFEPVDMTFVKLVQSVERLGLEHCIRTVAAAVLDESNPVRLQYPQGNSLYAQIAPQQFEPRAGSMLAHAAGITLDGFYGSSGILPSLLKIDVEGYEVAVLRGAQGMLSRLDRPALAFEYYPDTLRQCGAEPAAFHDLLAGYAIYYVDDFEGQRMPLGRHIDRLEEIEWGCNLFAVPAVEGCAARWASALQSAQHRIRALD